MRIGSALLCLSLSQATCITPYQEVKKVEPAPHPAPVEQNRQAQEPAPEPEKAQISYGAIKSKLIKGKTTQLDIVKLFGSPNIVTKSAEKNEVWVYSRQSTQTSAQSSSQQDSDASVRLNSFFGFYASGAANGTQKGSSNARTSSSISSACPLNVWLN
jgi:hypothetical protein